jgi:hypothetical protein
MKITLTQPHTHAGQALAPGEVLDLDDATARWLIERGAAVEAAPDESARAEPKPTRKGE